MSSLPLPRPRRPPVSPRSARCAARRPTPARGRPPTTAAPSISTPVPSLTRVGAATDNGPREASAHGVTGAHGARIPSSAPGHGDGDTDAGFRRRGPAPATPASRHPGHPGCPSRASGSLTRQSHCSLGRRPAPPGQVQRPGDEEAEYDDAQAGGRRHPGSRAHPPCENGRPRTDDPETGPPGDGMPMVILMCAHASAPSRSRRGPMTGVLNRLEHAGCIARRPDPADPPSRPGGPPSRTP